MDLIASIQECVQILMVSSDEITKTLHAGNERKAIQQLVQYLETFMCLMEAIAAIKASGSEYFNTVDVADLRDKLAEMEQAVITKDYILLADIIEYEIKEFLSALEIQCHH